jgi:hypothetical protein
LPQSGNTFWTQIATAAAATKDAALQSVQAFGRRISEDEKLAGEVRAALTEKNAGNNDRVTFEYYSDGGRSILDRPEVRKWYADFFSQFTVTKQQDGQSGFCTLTGRLRCEVLISVSFQPPTVTKPWRSIGLAASTWF